MKKPTMLVNRKKRFGAIRVEQEGERLLLHRPTPSAFGMWPFLLLAILPPRLWLIPACAAAIGAAVHHLIVAKGLAGNPVTFDRQSGMLLLGRQRVARLSTIQAIELYSFWEGSEGGSYLTYRVALVLDDPIRGGRRWLLGIAHPRTVVTVAFGIPTLLILFGWIDADHLTAFLQCCWLVAFGAGLLADQLTRSPLLPRDNDSQRIIVARLDRLWASGDQSEAEQFARRVADFLGVPVRERSG